MISSITAASKGIKLANKITARLVISGDASEPEVTAGGKKILTAARRTWAKAAPNIHNKIFFHRPVLKLAQSFFRNSLCRNIIKMYIT